jgi:hypothetical protein
MFYVLFFESTSIDTTVTSFSHFGSDDSCRTVALSNCTHDYFVQHSTPIPQMYPTVLTAACGLTRRPMDASGNQRFGEAIRPPIWLASVLQFSLRSLSIFLTVNESSGVDPEPTLMNGGSPVIKTERWPAVLEKEQTRFLLHSHGKVFPHPTRASRSSSDPLIWSWTGAR